MFAAMRRARPWTAALFVPILLTACGDDDDPAEIEFNEETADEFANAAASVTQPLSATSDVSATVSNAFFSLMLMGGSSSALSPVLPLEMLSAATRPDLARPRRLREALTVSGPRTAPTGILIPDSLYGTTFVWNVDSMYYVPSDQAGAPANGVRFIYYAIDPTGFGEPAVPLNPLGHLDLVDASTSALARLELELVRDLGDVTLADYFVQAAVTGNLVSLTATVSAEGFVNGDGEQIDFDIASEHVHTETSFDEDSHIIISNEAEDASITLDYDYAETATAFDEVGSLTIEHEGNEAEFEYTGEATSTSSLFEGSLLFNGDEVVVFSAEGNEEIEYTRPDGSALTADEIQALGRMWLAYVFTVFFTYGVILPFLFLLGV